MKNNTTRIISLVLLAFLAANCLRNIFTYYTTKFSTSNPLIPDYIIDQIVQEHLVSVAFSGTGTLLGLGFFLKSKYTMAIVTCVVAILTEPLFQMAFNS